MSNYYNVLIARPYTKDGVEKTAFPMKDKDGFSITLEALPLQSIGQTGKLECRMMLMQPLENDQTQQPVEKKTKAQKPLDDSIPF